MLPSPLEIALKEWAVVCRALQEGRQIVLLRKGGISESNGEFELERPDFLLFPTFLHQNTEALKPAEHAHFQPHSAEPAHITIEAAASVTDIIRIESRLQMDAIDEQHIWTPKHLDMRFNYRPENPLYLMMARVYVLPQALTIENTSAYAGCKSWVPLDPAISTSAARVVLTDEAYETRREDLRSALL